MRARARRAAPARRAPPLALSLGPRQDVPAQRVRHAPPALAHGASSAARTRSTCRASSSCIKALRAAADRRGAGRSRVYFVSASPPQIGKAIRDKLALDGVPYDGIVFKDQLQHLRRGKLRNLREHVGFKLGRAAPRPARRAARARASCCFGDDWESDSLTYSLYADVVAGRLAGRARSARILRRMPASTRGCCAEIRALAARAAGAGRRRPHLHQPRAADAARRRSASSAPRVVPTFNYFQTALRARRRDGYLDAEDVARVGARAGRPRPGYTPRRLENSLADLVRRRLLRCRDAERLAAAAARATACSAGPAARRRAGGGRSRPSGGCAPAPSAAPASAASPRAAPLDYDAILDRLHATARRGERVGRPA